MNVCQKLISILFFFLPTVTLFGAEAPASLEQAINVALDTFDARVTHLDTQADRAIRAEEWDKAYEIKNKLEKLSTASSRVFSNMPLSDSQVERLRTIVTKASNVSIKLVDAGIV